MKYKAVVKQIDIIEVDAISKEQAINIIKNNISPKALVEIEIVEEGIIQNIKEEKKENE